MTRARTALLALLTAFLLMLTGLVAGPAQAYNGTAYNTCAGTGGTVIIRTNSGVASTLSCGQVRGDVDKIITRGPTRIKRINSSTSVCYQSGFTYQLVTTTNVWNVARC